MVKIEFFIFLKKCKGTAMQFKKLQRYGRYFALHLKMNLLQLSGTSIYLFCLRRNPARDNLMVAPFSDLKELISRNTYNTKTKPYFF